jgi:hypothetical protein
MRYMLGALEVGSETPASSPGKEHYMDWLLELTEFQFIECCKVLDKLRRFEHNSQLFTMAVWNYQEYYDVLHSYLQAFINQNTDYINNYPAKFNINRIALNLLSSIRMYLDHIETDLKRRYGNKSHEVEKFEQICSQEYDGSFSYRFLYRLRNYAQHCGFPIHDISFTSKPNQIQNEYALTVRISRDKLLQDFDWKSLKSEVVAAPENIDFNEHIDNMVRSLNRIHLHVIQSEFGRLREEVGVIQDLLSHVSIGNGQPCIFELDIDEQDRSMSLKNLRIIGIPTKLIDAIIDNNLQDVTKNIDVLTV